MRKWVIYKITSPSGKIYIGKTANFKKRMRHYQYGDYKRQTRLYSSFIKYGYDSHEVKIIDEFENSNDYASGKEMFWIRSYMTNYCKYPEMDGLNLTDGGEGNIGYKASQETLQKMRENALKSNIGKWNFGKKYTEERKKEMSDYMKANPLNYWSGKKRSEETKKKMVENRRANGGYIVSAETRKKKSELAKGKPRPYLKGRPSKLKGTKRPTEVIEKCRQSQLKRYRIMTEEERIEKFGKHHIGATFNKGRKHTGEQLENIKLNMAKAREVKANKKMQAIPT